MLFKPRSKLNFYKPQWNINNITCIHPHSTQTEYIHIFCESCFKSRLCTRTINNGARVPRHQPELSPLRRSIQLYFASPLRRNLRGPAPAIRSNSGVPPCLSLTLTRRIQFTHITIAFKHQPKKTSPLLPLVVTFRVINTRLFRETRIKLTERLIEVSNVVVL